MGKIKIGLIILGSIALVGLVVAGVVTAKPPLDVKESDNGIGKAEYVSDEIIVKFKGDKEPFRVLKVPEGKVGEKIKEYSKRADVVYAEPNYIAYAQWVPNDPYYGYQWHLDNPVYGGIQMEEAWELLGAPGTPGQGVIVAIVDTGIAYETYGKYCLAPDLANTFFVPGYDFVNGDEHPNDDNRHGTHVAGTVAQSTNNSLGVAGVAFNTSLMPVKVLDSRGSGTYANVASGIRYAADNGAKVINLSLGGTSDSTTIKDAVAHAYGKGVTVVAACGNDNKSTCLYPAAYDDYVIAVGATQYDETKAPYSNYGPSLDLVAPGGNNDVDLNNDGYADGVLQQTFASSRQLCSFAYYFFQGTSMAAPHVAGTAALVLANGNATTPDEVRVALQGTTECLGGTCPNNTYGYGLVDAYAALGWSPAPVIACSFDSDCDDSNSCTADVCVNPGTTDAYCSNTAVADGITCDDGKFCTLNDVCTTGACSGVARDCSDAVACTVDSCDETVDACVNTPNNALCDDGVYCNGAETCSATLGCQAGTSINCNDDNECTTDTCNESLKACENIKVADDTTCTDGVCCSGICQIGITTCPTAVKCWSGTNLYLYRTATADQAKKFCKCAQGSYGYKSYKYNRSTKIVYQYLDTTDDTTWDVTSLSSSGPIYSVTCTDGKAYPTNLDYYYPK